MCLKLEKICYEIINFTDDKILAFCSNLSVNIGIGRFNKTVNVCSKFQSLIKCSLNPYKLPYLIVEKKWQITLYKNLFYFN